MAILVPSPPVEVSDDLVDGVTLDRGDLPRLQVVISKVHSVEVIVLALVVVGQVPVQAEVLQAQVVPFIGVRVVRHGVVVDVLARHEAAGEFDKLARVELAWAATFLLELSGDPATLHNQRSSVDANRVSRQSHELLLIDLAALVAVEGVDHIIASHLGAANSLRPRDQHFLAVVKLADDEVRFELMVDRPFFLRHTPPREVHLLPRRTVYDRLTSELVVSLRTLERLLYVLTIVEIREHTCGQARENSPLLHQIAFFGRHPLYQLLCVHVYFARAMIDLYNYT